MLFGVFLAIGCTGNLDGNRIGGKNTNESVTPVQTGNMTGNRTGMDGNVPGGMKLTLLDFSATWCGPCKMQKPILEELEKKYRDKVEFKVVDIDENRELASQYGIYAVPTLVILKDGVEVKRFTGVTQGNILSSELDKNL